MTSVLHVVSYYPPDRMGGVGEVVATLHRGLLAAGHSSRVVTTGDSRGDPTVLRVARSPAGFAMLSARAVALTRSADVIHVHHGEALGLLVAMQLARIETPVVLTLHVNVGAMAKASRPYRVGDRRLGAWSARDALHHAVVMPVREWMDRAAQAMADRVTFISRSAARDTLGAAATDATVIYNGLPSRSPGTGALPRRTELLYVGTSSLRKRVTTLPLVLAAVRRRFPDACLRIVGFEAVDNAELVALAESLGVRAAIRFEGRKRSEELAPFYRAADVLLVPSAYEGLPMVILEAFREGLPCVATRVSGHPEVVVDGESGRLVPPDDAEAMADAVVGLLADPALRSRMARAASDTQARDFAAERQVAEYLELYRRLGRES
jgi:glycosyltransferase involved in cell wall biosynthesis